MLAFHNDYLYTLVELSRFYMEPYRKVAIAKQEFYDTFFSQNMVGRSVAAFYELFERMTRHYPKPEFEITETIINDQKVKVHQEIVISKTFCKLLHFKKSGKLNQEKMLIVAPMSGHNATLCRGTVEGLLPFYDVYITDWTNARDVAVEEGYFHFDDFVDYVIEFLHVIGKSTNIMAVCQPSVPVLAAISLMSADADPYVPKAAILIGGPIDTRKNPTGVNDYAAEKTIQWLESNVITKVPWSYPGFMRDVYPGFTQLSGFMAMNMQTHLKAHTDLFQHLVTGDGESATAHKKFYNEYLAVMDLPAEFYLETVNIVFKKHSLPRGKLVCNAQIVDPGKITKTALLCIEGERDDISGRGQTKAAIDLCKNLPDNMKKYHLQKDVGHYGLFNGRKYREAVVPLICDFINKIPPLKE